MQALSPMHFTSELFLCSLQMAALLTTPFDVVKTHRQMELGELVFSKFKHYPGTTSPIYTWTLTRLSVCMVLCACALTVNLDLRYS